MGLEAIVTAAVEAARDEGVIADADTDTSPDTTGDAGGDGSSAAGADDTPAAVSVGGDAPGAESTPGSSGAGGAERKWDASFDTETVKILEELGYNPPQKDNRMPYSKSLKGIAEGVKKARAKDAEASKKVQDELAAARKKAEDFDRLQERVNKDADGFMDYLASQRGDLYGKYVKAVREGNKTPESQKTDAQVARDNDPQPQPDIKYDDGSTGFSAAQFQKHNEWLIREGVRQANEAADKRIKSIEDERAQEKAERAAAKAREGLADSTRQLEAKAVRRWGALFTSNKDKILEAMKADDAKAPIVGYSKTGVPIKRLTPFDDICFDVLQPLKEAALTADHNKVREQVMKELQERPAAASKKAPARTAVVEEDSGEPKKMTDVTRQALRDAGMLS